MASSSSAEVFEWGDREPGTSSSYESMLYRGVRYRLQDCVFITSGLPSPYVGKLMRLYEDEQGVKKIRTRWFFRPFELPIHVSTDARNVATTKELFIAIGAAKGVENENEVGVIRGKANVLCTARFSINPMPPQALIDAADHVFNRAYDLVRKKLVKMANVDNKFLARKLMNKLEWVQPPQNEHVRNQASTSAQVQNQASTSEGSTSYTTSKGVFNLVRKKRFVSIPARVGTKVKKLKKF